jgi:hypothetical protein
MNCEEFRTLIGADPNSNAPEVLEHVAQCPDCARYRQEMQAMDRLIYRALAIDVAAAATTPKATPQTPSVAATNPSRIWRMAASLLITASLVAVTSLWLLTPRDSFADEVIAHVLHERGSLIRTDATVDTARVEEILATSNVRLRPGAARVSYAMSCEFRGHRIPHLVVQSEHGPVTVLVMTQVPSQQREDIDEDGFQGVILPAPHGVIVVLGQNVPVEAVASTVISALDYETSDWDSERNDW